MILASIMCSLVLEEKEGQDPHALFGAPLLEFGAFQIFVFSLISEYTPHRGAYVRVYCLRKRLDDEMREVSL